MWRYWDKYNLRDQDAMRLLNTIRDPGDLKELKSKLEGLKGTEAAEILKELNRILRTNWSGANYSKRIWGNTRGLTKELKTQMTLAYLTGKNESEIAGELANKYATGAAYARRLVRTESAYVSGQAQAAADQEAGIESYKIIATLDLRTSNICREMDGKEFAYKDMEVGVNYPPFHPFCRTTVLSELDDQNLGELKRRSRDPETGKVKTFSGDITYQKWYESEVANNPEALFAEQVAMHRGADLQQHERYVERLGKKRVGSIDDFRELKYKTPGSFESLKREYFDVGELSRHREILGGLDELKNIDTFKELKYNNLGKWGAIHTAYKDKKLQESIKDGGYNLKIHKGKQGKHIPGYNNYTEGRSYLTITEEQCQELVNKYAGTGRIIRNSKDGKWQSKEHNIGQYISTYEDLSEPTHAFLIVYSKDGTHIIPARKE